jgi:hypothetical protein
LEIDESNVDEGKKEGVMDSEVMGDMRNQASA